MSQGRAYESAAHLSILLRRCGHAPADGGGDDLLDELAVHATAIPCLAACLEPGGLGAAAAARALRPLVERDTGPLTAADIAAVPDVLASLVGAHVNLNVSDCVTVASIGGCSRA